MIEKNIKNHNLIKFKKKLGSKNTNISLTIPIELSVWLNLSPGKIVTLIPDEGRYGKFIAIFVEKGDTNDSNSKPTQRV